MIVDIQIKIVIIISLNNIKLTIQRGTYVGYILLRIKKAVIIKNLSAKGSIIFPKVASSLKLYQPSVSGVSLAKYVTN